MFCDRCGTAVPLAQRYCGKCGREFPGSIAIAYPSPSRVQSHVRLLGILWLAISALNAVVGLLLFVIGNVIMAHIHELGAPSDVPAGLLRSLFTVFGLLVLTKAFLGFFAGWGLLRREPWARMLTIVLGVLALFEAPHGTALGIYSLWVLLPAESERDYEKEASVAA